MVSKIESLITKLFSMMIDITIVIDAAASGALNGGKLACNVLCILIAFLALIALANGPLAR